MKNKKKIFEILILIFIVIIFILLNYLNIKNKKKKEDNLNNKTISNTELDYLEMKNDSVMYDENTTLEELKDEYKITGKDEIYDIETESDGRKVVNVKPTINYKVAFAGMMKNRKPSFEELESIFKEKSPTEKGIWILAKDREKILKYLNNNEKLNSKYDVDNGYLKVTLSENLTDFDKKVEKLINSDNQYIFSISSKYYMVDPVTGEIVDNPYNELEEYQTYEYVECENRMIVFITENENKVMNNDDIFESIINLLEF